MYTKFYNDTFHLMKVEEKHQHMVILRLTGLLRHLLLREQGLQVLRDARLVVPLEPPAQGHRLQIRPATSDRATNSTLNMCIYIYIYVYIYIYITYVCIYIYIYVT